MSLLCPTMWEETPVLSAQSGCAGVLWNPTHQDTHLLPMPTMPSHYHPEEESLLPVPSSCPDLTEPLGTLPSLAG